MQVRAAIGRTTRQIAEAPGPVLAMSLRLRQFDDILRRFWPAPSGLHAVDLGAGHGMFAMRAQRQGFRVTAVDARDRWTPAEAMTGTPPDASAAGLPDIQWIKEDVQGHDLAPYDVILVIGLFYHLTLHVQRDLLLRSAGRPTVIDTEIFDPEDPVSRACERLTPITLEGNAGALLRETGHHWSAASPQPSFWPTHEAFLALCAAAGRQSVTIIDPPYRSRFGPRRWYVLDAPS